MNRLAAVVVALLLVSTTKTTGAESLEGQVRVGIDGLSLRDAGFVVVYLVDDGAGSRMTGEPPPVAIVRQRGAAFTPRFLIVSTGQKVEMPNDDVIFHNVFSYSEPNDFDLGLYAAGRSKTIEFLHPGLVRIYCSIHESMDGLIFVAPSRLFAAPDAQGRYSIRDVPPGRYHAHVWSERLPEISIPVAVRPGTAVSLDITLGQSDF